MDWTTSVTTINSVLTDAAPIMAALVAVTVGIMAFKKIKGLMR